jgi:transcriptional regulator with XRE-family HTH domain
VLALRKAAGLTQIELAKALDIPQANIAFWEWSDKPAALRSASENGQGLRAVARSPARRTA